jgi:hypothetical protein
VIGVTSVKRADGEKLRFISTEILESTSGQVAKRGLPLSINGLQIHDVNHHMNPTQGSN